MVKIMLKNENVCNKTHFIGFLLRNILYQMFKIYAIVEILVTLCIVVLKV